MFLPMVMLAFRAMASSIGISGLVWTMAAAGRTSLIVITSSTVRSFFIAIISATLIEQYSFGVMERLVSQIIYLTSFFMAIISSTETPSLIWVISLLSRPSSFPINSFTVIPILSALISFIV